MEHSQIKSLKSSEGDYLEIELVCAMHAKEI